MAYGTGSLPLYQEVYEKLRERIQAGTYPPGTSIPSETRLRDEFGVSTITVRRAVHELVLDGLVESRQGIGNIVRDSTQSNIAVNMSSFTSDVAAGRLRLVRTLMTDVMVPSPIDVAERLGVQPGSMVRYMVRLDHEGGEPFGYDRAFVPPAFAGDITTDVAASPLFMHLWQETAGISLVKTSYDVWVEMPNEDDQRLLQTDADVPVLVTGELVFDSSERPCAWIESRYRGDRGRLSATVTLVQQETDRGIIGE